MSQLLDKPISLTEARREAVRSEAGDLSAFDADVHGASPAFTLNGPTSSIGIPTELVPLIVAMLEQLIAGNAVTVAPVGTELTTQQTADLLNVSRPHIVKLIEQRKLPAKLVGTHRRILLEDALAYRDRDDAARRATADALSAELDEFGMGY